MTGGANRTTTAILKFFASACGTDERQSAHWAAASLLKMKTQKAATVANNRMRITLDDIMVKLSFLSPAKAGYQFFLPPDPSTKVLG